MEKYKGFKFLLFYRWLCINVFGFALLTAAHLNGWIQLVIDTDPTYISELIILAFLWGLYLCGRKAWKTSKELNYIQTGEVEKSRRWKDFMELKASRKKSQHYALVESLKMRIFSKIYLVRWIAHSLVFLGLIGTVVGFIIALSGIDASVVSDVNSVGPMISTMIQGMSIAFYTTLVGAVFHVWLMVNYNILAMGTSDLVSRILEANE